MKRSAGISAWLAAALTASALGCNEAALKQPPPDAGASVAGLSAEQAARVVAKVGDRAITLGDFARTLERMDQFDRLRYQTKERRRELLNELIDVELLALEAQRRGLDKEPATKEAVRQILRDAMLAQTRSNLPAPADIPASEVRAYYEANESKFTEPERRRVAVISMADPKEAEKVLKLAQKAKSAAEWGELVYKHSQSAPKTRGPNTPVELAGDAGIVGPPGDAKGGNPRVPEAVRAAAFRIANVGEVAGEIVSEGGAHYIVRLNGLTAGHRRTLAEADRSIRIALLQERMAKIERELDAELRKKFPVEIDAQALATVKMPSALDQPDVGSGPSPSTYQEAAAAGAPAGTGGGSAQSPDGGP